MDQRVPRRAWNAPGRPGHRPRVLIEDAHPALAISDFSLFEQAGFDVAFCAGPGRDPQACPLLRGQECAALAGADVVLHGLDPGLGIAAAIRQQHPGTPVVAEQHRSEDGGLEAVPAGCLPLVYPCSVKGQIDALRRALARTRQTRMDARQRRPLLGASVLQRHRDHTGMQDPEGNEFCVEPGPGR